LYKKTCPFCHGDSYSAASGSWICPYCRSDLSSLPPEPATGKAGNRAANRGPGKVVPLHGGNSVNEEYKPGKNPA